MSIAKKYTKYVSMSILGLIGLSCYILADTFFIANGVGEAGLSALNIALPAYNFIFGVGMMIGMGGATRFTLSRNSDTTRSGKVFTHAFIYALLFSLVFVVLGIFFSRPLASLLGADGEIIDNTAIYLKVVLIFSPMFILNNIVICFVRNDGNPKIAMLAMLIGSLSNVVLDYVMIFPLGMGMFGAVLATGLSPIISLMILSIHYLKKKCGFRFKKTFPKFAAVKDISVLGVSSLITELSSGIVIIVFNNLILKLSGNTGVAAYGIIANLALVIISMFTGISQGAQPLLSENYAVGNNHNVKKVYKYALITSAVLAATIYAVCFIFARQLTGLFNRDNSQALTDIAVKGIRIYFSAFLFVGFNIFTATFFNSINKPKFSFSISLLRGLILIVPVAFIMAYAFGMTGIWLTLTVTEVIVSVLSTTLIIRHFVKEKSKKAERN